MSFIMHDDDEELINLCTPAEVKYFILALYANEKGTSLEMPTTIRARRRANIILEKLESRRKKDAEAYRKKVKKSEEKQNVLSEYGDLDDFFVN